MKTNRRKFFQLAGVASAGVLSGGITSCNVKATGSSESALASIKEAVEKKHSQQFNMSGYAAPKLKQ